MGQQSLLLIGGISLKTKVKYEPTIFQVPIPSCAGNGHTICRRDIV